MVSHMGMGSEHTKFTFGYKILTAIAAYQKRTCLDQKWVKLL